MKEGYYVMGCAVLFQICRVIYIYYKRWQEKRVDVEIADVRWNTYLKRREEMLSVKPADLNLELSEDKETAFGVALEMHTGAEVQLISIFQTGEMWVLSTRNARKDKFIAKNENMIAAATLLLSIAQYNFARMRRKYVSVPEPGYSKFYIHTGNDVYSAASSINDIILERSDWQELFVKVKEVIEQDEISRSTS